MTEANPYAAPANPVPPAAAPAASQPAPAQPRAGVISDGQYDGLPPDQQARYSRSRGDGTGPVTSGANLT